MFDIALIFFDLKAFYNGLKALSTCVYILSVNEKLPVSRFGYFGKYIMQLFGYCSVHVSGQRQADLER